jgi:hypothetical protein
MEGFKTAGLTLRRRTDVDWQDVRLFDKLRIFAAGDMVYEGRVTSLPASGLFQVDVSATGLVAELRDHRVTPLYVDRDLAQWQDTTLARKVARRRRITRRSPRRLTRPGSGSSTETRRSRPRTSGSCTTAPRTARPSAMVIYKATNSIGAQAILAPFLVSDDNDAFTSGTSVLTPISTARTTGPDVRCPRAIPPASHPAVLGADSDDGDVRGVHGSLAGREPRAALINRPTTPGLPRRTSSATCSAKPRRSRKARSRHVVPDLAARVLRPDRPVRHRVGGQRVPLVELLGVGERPRRLRPDRHLGLHLAGPPGGLRGPGRASRRRSRRPLLRG